MTKREKTGIVLVITGFLLVLLGCCMVADNPYRLRIDRPGSVRTA